MPRRLFVVLDYPRQIIDGRLQQLARRRGWRLLSIRRGQFYRRGFLRGDAVVAVSASVPRAGQAAIAKAFAALARNDMVYAPDEDGFYWLIGWSRHRRIPRAMFRAALDEALAAMPANFWVELLPSEDYPPLEHGRTRKKRTASFRYVSRAPIMVRL